MSMKNKKEEEILEIEEMTVFVMILTEIEDKEGEVIAEIEMIIVLGEEIEEEELEAEVEEETSDIIFYLKIYQLFDDTLFIFIMIR